MSCPSLSPEQVTALQAQLAQLQAAKMQVATGQVAQVVHGDRKVIYHPIDAVRLDRLIADVQTQLGLRARGRSRRINF